MIAAVIEAPEQVALRDLTEPHAGPGEVRLRVHATGVCGTDLHLLHGHFGAALPLVAGHEISGFVDEVGAGVTHVREGELVTLDPNLSCGACYACQRKLFQHCEHHEAIGVTRAGGFAQYVIVPARSVYSAHGLTPDQATFAEPLACVAWGMKRLEPQLGASAVLFGAGAIGLLLMQALLASGASSVTVVDPVPERRALAEQLGAAHTLAPHGGLQEELLDRAPHGYDVSAEATGVGAVVQQLPALTAIAGKVLIFGVAPEDARVHISPYDFFRRDLTLLGSFALNGDIPLALDWMRAGRVRVEPLITHRLPLSRVGDALNLKAHPGLQGAQKVFIQPWEENL